MAPDDLLRCPQLGREIAAKHCARMQTARAKRTVVLQAATDFEGCQRPRRTEERDAGPAYPYCASGECALGREAAAASAGPAPAALRPRAGERGGLLWRGEVPDVPIGPPPSHRAPTAIGLTAPDEGERQPSPAYSMAAASQEHRTAHHAEVRHATSPGKPGASPAQDAPVDHEPPASPAQEDPMACPECSSKTCHKATCSRRPAARKAEGKSAPERKRVAAAGKLDAAKLVTSPLKASSKALAAARKLNPDALLARREALGDELRAVNEVLQETIAREEERIRRLRAAVDGVVDGAPLVTGNYNASPQTVTLTAPGSLATTLTKNPEALARRIEKLTADGRV